MTKRLDIKAILADQVQRRELAIQTIIATQAREGIVGLTGKLEIFTYAYLH